MSAVDDHYLLPIPALFLIVLRYTALFISVVLPATYVAFTAYNPEIYRVQLALSIAGSRSSVPYPAFIEVLFMLIMMEFLIEASVRLPKTVGQAAATVGGLILGQAATQAALVSNIMIIIVAAVAISNFVLPITSMGLTVRVAKYFLLFMTIFFGTYGLLIGLFILIDYTFLLESFSQPFFNPIGVDFKRIFSRLKKGNF
jgi:spore germination protein